MAGTDRFAADGTNASTNQKTALDKLDIPSGRRLTFHMTHLNHLDLTWYWRLPDTIEMCLETIRWHVEMLEKHPDARYSHTQVFILKVVEQIDPGLFERFAELARQGRVELDSGQWVEPDHNLPDGESLARQFLYGQGYIKDRFGIRAATIVNSDSFGHCRSLPQIASQAGIRHFIFKRPRQKFVSLPETPFIWQGIDGTSVYALRFINKGEGLPSLSQYYQLPEGTTDLQEKVNRNLKAGINHLFGSHCNADSGDITPYTEPVSSDSYILRYSTPTEFFTSLLDEKPVLPVIDKTLNYVYPGCYTTHIEEEQNCRRAERELREIKLLWAHNALLGDEYPIESISACWRRLCFLQFHDILPGTGSPEAHSESSAMYSELFLQLNILRRKAQLILGSCVPNTGALRTILAANTQPVNYSGIVSADLEMPIKRGDTSSELLPETGTLTDDTGTKTPYQIVDIRRRQRYVRGTILFCASNIRALGFKAFQITNESLQDAEVKADISVIENEYLRVEVGGNGLIKSISSKADNREFLMAGDAPVRIELWPEIEYEGDYGSPMKAWFLGVTDKRENATCIGDPTVTENGPVRATIRVEQQWGNSVFKTDISRYAGQPWIDLNIEIDWHEKEVLARLCVEPNLEGPAERLFGIPFGTETASGEEMEVPVVGWADVSDSTGGIAVLNIGNPGHTFRDNSIRGITGQMRHWRL